MKWKVSVITIAYNSEACIGRTIESVLAQDYDNMEYIIIDGASTDKTVEVAERYREALEKKGVEYKIFSAADTGIYNAMNKGIRLATGDITGILNSGDRYVPEAVRVAADTFEAGAGSENRWELLFGNIRICKTNGTSFVKKARLRRYQTSRDWNHPTMFVKSGLYKEFPFRELGIHDDYGFYLQMVKQKRKIVVVDRVLAEFDMGGASNRKKVSEAIKRIRDRYKYCYRVNGYSRWYLAECVAMEAVKFFLG